MGFYIRKGFNFGLLHVNFSKSGIGFSVGIKGLRVGSGPKGNYMHVGRKGVYYKESLPDVGSKNFLRLSWPVIVVLAVIVGGVYFYLQADGNMALMKDLFLKQLKM